MRASRLISRIVLVVAISKGAVVIFLYLDIPLSTGFGPVLGGLIQ